MVNSIGLDPIGLMCLGLFALLIFREYGHYKAFAKLHKEHMAAIADMEKAFSSAVASIKRDYEATLGIHVHTQSEEPSTSKIVH